MPQLRSYQSGASTPNIGSAYVGGAKVAQEELDSQRRAANARAAIAQQAQEANMRAQAAQQQLQQQAVMKQQEIAIQQAMHTSQLEMKSRELDQEQAQQQAMMGFHNRELGLNENKFDLEAKEAARVNLERQGARRFLESKMKDLDMSNNVGTGEAPMEMGEEASRDAMRGAAMRYPGAIPPGVQSQLFRQQGSSAGGMATRPSAFDLEGAPGTKMVETQKGHYSFVPVGKATLPDDATAQPVLDQNGKPTGMLQYNKKLFPAKMAQDEKDIRAEKKALDAWFESNKSVPGRIALNKQKGGGELNMIEKGFLDEYLKKQKDNDELKVQLRAMLGGTPANGGGSRTNNVKVIRINPAKPAKAAQ
jgi:hypothetical protein